MAGILRVAAITIALSSAARTPVLATDSPTLAVRVIDYANAASGVLIEAEHHVTRVFGVAGINVAWREGDAALPPNAAAQVTVLVLSDAILLLAVIWTIFSAVEYLRGAWGMLAAPAKSAT